MTWTLIIIAILIGMYIIARIPGREYDDRMDDLYAKHRRNRSEK